MRDVYTVITKDVISGKDMLHIQEPKKAFTPNEVYELLKKNNCYYASFNTSIKEYYIDDLKGKENWDGIKPKR